MNLTYLSTPQAAPGLEEKSAKSKMRATVADRFRAVLHIAKAEEAGKAKIRATLSNRFWAAIRGHKKDGLVDPEVTPS